MASVSRAFHKPLGSIVLVKPVTDRLGLRELVDKYVPMERNRGDGLSHGQVIEALVANRLSSPRPLYRVEDWASQKGFYEQLLKDSRALVFDLSCIFSYSENLRLAEKGYNTRRLYLKQVNFALFFSLDKKVPVMPVSPNENLAVPSIFPHQNQGSIPNS